VILLKRKLSVNVESRTLKKIVTALKSFGDVNRIDEIIRFADVDLDAKVKFFFLSLNLNLIFHSFGFRKQFNQFFFIY
jgi:hypothetical protein